jgi:hypothetical protein
MLVKKYKSKQRNTMVVLASSARMLKLKIKLSLKKENRDVLFWDISLGVPCYVIFLIFKVVLGCY